MRTRSGYTPPRIQTLEARQIVEALGPVSAGSGGSPQCIPAAWMGGC